MSCCVLGSTSISLKYKGAFIWRKQPRKTFKVYSFNKDPRQNFNKNYNANQFDRDPRSNNYFYGRQNSNFYNYDDQFGFEDNKISVGQIFGGLSLIIFPLFVLDFFGDEPISLILPLSLFFFPPVRKFSISLFSALLRSAKNENQQQKYWQQNQNQNQNYYQQQQYQNYENQYDYDYQQQNQRPNLNQRALPGDVPPVSFNRRNQFYQNQQNNKNFGGFVGKQLQEEDFEDSLIVKRGQNQNRVGVYIKNQKTDELPIWVDIICTVFPFMRSWAGFL